MNKVNKTPEHEIHADTALNIASKTPKKRRVIKGNLPYTVSPSSITAVLRKVIDAETPEKFSNDFLETKLGASGGAARSVPPLLKKIGLLTGDGTPTELYKQFRSPDSRSDAMLAALKQGYRELYSRNEYAHELNDNKLDGLIIEITGLPTGDSIISYIRNSFKNFKAFIEKEKLGHSVKSESIGIEESAAARDTSPQSSISSNSAQLGLTYNINIVIPETDDVKVLNAIFQAVNRNLMD